MKEIIALQEYSDKHISLYEGEIRNIQDKLAEQLIEKNVVAEHIDEGTGGGNGVTVIEGIMRQEQNTSGEVMPTPYLYALNKPAGELLALCKKGPVFVSFMNAGLEQYELIKQYGFSELTNQYVFILVNPSDTTAVFIAASENEIPQLPIAELDNPIQL